MSEVDVAVVGGGLAGLNAALAVARLGHRCTAFCGPSPGGLLLSVESVEGLPGHPDGVPGYDLGPMAQEAALDAGADCLATEAEQVRHDGDHWLVTGGSATVRSHALILAPGSRLQSLDVPGEQRLFGKGVSHCASCDAPMLRGRTAAVVGGGDSACQEALTVAAHAAAVHLLVRGPALRAAPQWQRRIAAQPNIALHFGSRVEEIVGDAVVSGVRLAGGQTLAVDAVFVYVGLLPNTGWLAGVVPLGGDGRIVVDADLRTSLRGLFAAGNARLGSSGQAADAASDGLRAAEAAHHHLSSLS